MRRALVAVATALLVVTAGCAATPGTGTPAAGGGDTGGDGATSGDDSTAAASDSGTVNFYVSDRPNDMDDFRHLNVTVRTVKFHLVEAADNGSAAGEVSEDEADDKEREGSRWVTRDVNATSVDLSALRGANATLLEQFDLPAGEYDTVHMEVSEVDATLTDGDDQRVKLPSGKLKLNTEFTVANGSAVDFVYDVSVHEAGNSGKYVLKPVVGESGTGVEIERVDDERAVSASFLGNVTAGETVTAQVTEGASGVANATVLVDGERVGTTDANGEYVVDVPAGAEELEVTVEAGDAEAELEAEFEGNETETDETGTAGEDGEDNQSVGG